MTFKKTVAIDFDGVIHGYSKGWQKGVIYDPPMEGTEEALKHLAARYTLDVFTVRTDLAAVVEWLQKHHLAQYIHNVTNEKPIAVLYIDDRGLRFTSWATALIDVAQLETQTGPLGGGL